MPQAVDPQFLLDALRGKVPRDDITMAGQSKEATPPEEGKVFSPLQSPVEWHEMIQMHQSGKLKGFGGASEFLKHPSCPEKFKVFKKRSLSNGWAQTRKVALANLKGTATDEALEAEPSEGMFFLSRVFFSIDRLTNRSYCIIVQRP